jgi:fatty acid desaturase
MLSTTDYAPDSTFLKILSVSLNYQIVHHMFPSIHPAHYPAIRKLLIPIAKKYDIDYEKRSSQTFGEALTNYYNWIYSLNENPKEKVLCMRKSTLYGIIGTSVMVTTTFVLPMYYLF